MTAKNDVTGDSIKSKPTSEKYRENWDKIFRNKEKRGENEESRNSRLRLDR